MPQLFNSAEDIIRAFELGRQAKQQQEQLALKQQQDQRDYEEGKRQFDERLKQEQERLKHEDAYREQIQKLQKIQRDAAIATLRSGELDRMAQRGLVPKTQTQVPGLTSPIVGTDFGNVSVGMIPDSYNPHPNIEGFNPYTKDELIAADSYFNQGEQAKARQAQMLQESERKSAEAEANRNSAMERTLATIGGNMARTQTLADKAIEVAKIAAAARGASAEGTNSTIGQDDNVDNDFLTGSRSMEDLIALTPAKNRGTAISNLKKKDIIPLSKKHIEAIDAMEEASSIIDDIASLKPLVSISASLNPLSPYSRKKEFIRARIGKLRDSLGGKALGVLSNYDLERLEGALPNSKDVVAKTVDMKIAGIKKLHNDSADRLLKNMSERQRAYFETQRRLYAK